MVKITEYQKAIMKVVNYDKKYPLLMVKHME